MNNDWRDQAAQVASAKKSVRRLADIVVRVYEDDVHDERLAARLAARLILRRPDNGLTNAERTVLEELKSGDISADDPRVEFAPECFVVVDGETRCRDAHNNNMPSSSFGAESRTIAERIEQRLRNHRGRRYKQLGGSSIAVMLDIPLWDYVHEWVAARLRVSNAKARLLAFVRQVLKGRAVPRDPVANELRRLDREGATDQLLRDLWTLYEVQAIDLKLPELADDSDEARPQPPKEAEDLRCVHRAAEPGVVVADRPTIKLSEVAKRISRTKDAIQKVLSKASDVPKPCIRGKSGQPHLYWWDEMREFCKRVWKIDIGEPQKKPPN